MSVAKQVTSVEQVPILGNISLQEVFRLPPPNPQHPLTSQSVDNSYGMVKGKERKL